MAKRNNRQKRLAGFASAGFEFAGIRFHPLSVGRLMLLEAVESPYFTGKGSKLEGLVDWLFISASDDLAKTTALASDRKAFKAAAVAFADRLSPDQLSELERMFSEASEDVEAARTEAEPGKPEAEGEGAETPPRGTPA
jgi:hypothetical protein